MYTIEYVENGTWEETKKWYCVARSKAEAYSKFMEEHGNVYAAWVARVTYNNGNVREFNTFPGNPY